VSLTAMQLFKRCEEDIKPYQTGLPKERPHCRSCGKELKLVGVSRVYNNDRFKVPAVLEMDKIIRIGSGHARDQVFLDWIEFIVWNGTFGNDGDGYFCSDSCGYDYAIKTLEKKERQKGEHTEDALPAEVEGFPRTLPEIMTFDMRPPDGFSVFDQVDTFFIFLQMAATKMLEATAVRPDLINISPGLLTLFQRIDGWEDEPRSPASQTGFHLPGVYQAGTLRHHGIAVRVDSSIELLHGEIVHTGIASAPQRFKIENMEPFWSLT